MTTDEDILRKRLTELAQKADTNGLYTYTGFLSIAQIAVFHSMLPRLGDIPYTLWGGTQGCERQMLRFGSAELCGYSENMPVLCVQVTPLSRKFADELTHRDFLGALMSLAIERSTLGDIIIKDNVGYVFCVDRIAPYITESLTQIKHTSVHSALTSDIPCGALYAVTADIVQVTSERIDAIIARAYKLSRSESLDMFRTKHVFINGALCEDNSHIPKNNDIVSVRGFGRFIYRGVEGTSKKGKLKVMIAKYEG
ncbi:MAG: YlmH/Sll1252 family protein [Clostridia bacterium]